MSATSRPLRADAVRSAGRILAAARELYSAEGADVPLEEIARHAGVGVRTLYRRFPTRADLALAALEQCIAEDVAPVVQAALGDPDSLRSLTTVIEAAVAMTAREYHLLAAAQNAGALTPEIYTPFQETLERLIRRGQDEGVVRPDLHPDDLPRIMVMLIGVQITMEPGSAGWRRYLSLMIDSLSTAPARPLPPLVPRVVENIP